MELVRGKNVKAIKVVLYGVEGIGKSTFASHFPGAIFIDTEGSTDAMDVTRTQKPQSWTELLMQVDYFIKHPDELGTLVIDTADWAEKMAIDEFCASKKISGIEDMGYGKGYVYVAEDFGKLLNKLDTLREKGVHIVLNAHAMMRKFEQPDELGAYDRWELKLSKKVAPMVKEWADLLLFANYKTFVVNVDGQGAAKGKNKANGAKRVMYTQHAACWDAKNRFGLPDELPFDYSQIAKLVGEKPVKAQSPEQDALTAEPAKSEQVAPDQTAPVQNEDTQSSDEIDYTNVPPALVNLMVPNAIRPVELMVVVGQKGYYPADTPISAYDPGFVAGCLIKAWDKVEPLILANRAKAPF